MTEPLPLPNEARWSPAREADATTGGPSPPLDRHGPIRPNRPEGVVRNLPRMAVGIDEDPRVAAPEGRGTRPADGRSGGLCLGQGGVDLLGRTDVVGSVTPPQPPASSTAE